MSFNKKGVYGEYTLVDRDKLERAIFGTVSRENTYVGGVGENASDEEVIAEYDKLGGLIKKGNNKLRIGCFYDFAKKKPREKPEELFEVVLEGDILEVNEGEAVALQSAKEKVSAIRRKRATTVKNEEEGEEEELVRTKRVRRTV